MKRLPHIAILFAAVLLVAADKKDERTKEPAPSAAQIQLWVKQLGDESFSVREEATQELIKAGAVAFDAVTKASNSEDAEMKQRALIIIKQIKQLEKAAIVYFDKLGGWVKVDDNRPGRPVIMVYLKATKITDAGLVHLKGLTKLQSLELDDTKITDSGLLHLKGLTNLRVLKLKGTRVTRAGYEKLLKALPKCDIKFQPLIRVKLQVSIPPYTIDRFNPISKDMYGVSAQSKRHESQHRIPNRQS